MSKGRRGSPANAGFTLVELMVVIAIAGLMLAVGTFTLRNLFRSNLRSAASKTAAAMRFTFDRALMTGSYLRVALDIDKGQIWIEKSSARVSLRKGRKQHVKGKDDAKDQDEADADKEREEKQSKTPSPLGLLGGAAADEGEDGEGSGLGFDPQELVAAHERDLKPIKRPKPRFAALKTLGAKRIKLPDNIVIEGVMTPRLEEPADKGIAYVYFFPQGHGEPAIVRMRTEDSEDYYSVVLHPLTGQARVYNCRYRIPEQFGEDDGARRRGQDRCEDE